MAVQKGMAGTCERFWPSPALESYQFPLMFIGMVARVGEPVEAPIECSMSDYRFSVDLVWRSRCRPLRCGKERGPKGGGTKGHDTAAGEAPEFKARRTLGTGVDLGPHVVRVGPIGCLDDGGGGFYSCHNAKPEAVSSLFSRTKHWPASGSLGPRLRRRG